MLSPLSYYLPTSLLSYDKSIIDIIPTLVPKAALSGNIFHSYEPTIFHLPHRLKPALSGNI